MGHAKRFRRWLRHHSVSLHCRLQLGRMVHCVLGSLGPITCLVATALLQAHTSETVWIYARSQRNDSGVNVERSHQYTIKVLEWENVVDGTGWTAVRVPDLRGWPFCWQR